MKSLRRGSTKSNVSSDTSRFVDKSSTKLEVIKEVKKEEVQEKNENENTFLKKMYIFINCFILKKK